MEDKVFLKWDDIEDLVTIIINKLRERGYTDFDTIIAIARGGVIPGALLAYKLDCHNLQQLGVRTRHVESTQFYGSPQLAGKVLIVDDINDSGKTFEEVEKYIKYHFDHDEIKSIQYTSLIVRNGTSFERDDTIYGSRCFHNDWFVFPWD